MEDKDMVDCSFLCGLSCHRRRLFFSRLVQIYTRWLSSPRFFISPNNNYGYMVRKERYVYELNHKVSSEYVRDSVSKPNINRVPGMGLLYSELVQGIPPIFPHFISNIPSIHSVLVFVSIKSIPITKVALEERFLFREVKPRALRMFRSVVICGYKDKIEEPQEFERQLVQQLKEFIRHEHFILEGGTAEQLPVEPANSQHSTLLVDDRKVKGSTVHVEESLQQRIPSRVSSSSNRSIVAASSTHSSNRINSSPLQGADEEMQFVEKSMERGVVYLLGETEVVAEENSSLLKKIAVNYAYSFLRNNFRQGDKTLAIPKSRILKVGMTYEI